MFDSLIAFLQALLLGAIAFFAAAQQWPNLWIPEVVGIVVFSVVMVIQDELSKRRRVKQIIAEEELRYRVRQSLETEARDRR